MQSRSSFSTVKFIAAGFALLTLAACQVGMGPGGGFAPPAGENPGMPTPTQPPVSASPAPAESPSAAPSAAESPAASASPEASPSASASV